MTARPADGAYRVLAAAAAHWDRVDRRLAPAERARLVALGERLRSPGAEDAAAHREAAEQAASLLLPHLPGGLADRLGARWAGPPSGPGHQGYRFDDLAVLLTDGHRMVGPVLGEVRERLLAEPSRAEDTVRRAGADPRSPGLIRLPGPGGALRLPDFQFTAGGTPRPVVTEVNGLLDAGRDPWGAADWWLSENAWLGDRPVRLLGTPRERALPGVAGHLLEGD